jgi:transcriptional regulator with XRE-family HTH domain
MSDLIQRKELAAFLRSRREATDPVSMGLEPGPRRRTPGLRREELAQLSGVSVTWYTWLEQARDISVSRQVIDSLARTLRMQPDERAHLFTLAGLALPSERPSPPHVDDTLRRLVEELGPNPACVISLWWDLLVVNDAYASMIGNLQQRPEPERNTLWIAFTDKRARDLYLDWDAETQQLAGQLRVQLAQHPEDPRGHDLVQALQAASPRFAELWQEQAIARFHGSRKRFHHPTVGDITLDYVKLAAADDTNLIAFLPADATSRRALHSLA